MERFRWWVFLLAIGWLGAAPAHAQEGGVLFTPDPRAAELSNPDKEGLGPYLNLSVRGDVLVEGVGLRGIGEGDIVVTEIPAGATVIRAILYWATLGSDGTFTGPTLNTVTVQGERIGTGADTCWDADANYVYRADVSSLVDGNGVYRIAGLPAEHPTTNDSQGAALVVVYRTSSGPRRAILINDGAIVINGQRLKHTDLISGFDAAQPLDAHITYLVGDGQIIFTSGRLKANGTTVSTDALVGADGDYWDTPTYPVPGSVTGHEMTAKMEISVDCLLWAGSVLSVVGEGAKVFEDGFETGDADRWSVRLPAF